MNNPAKLLLSAAMVLLGGCATAHSSAADAPLESSALELVDARRGSMAMSVFALGAASAAGESGKPLGSAALPARGLASFARSIPALFRDDTAGMTENRALPALWSDPAGFAARAADFQAATAALETAVRADDRAAFTAALASTKAACKACHDSYRAEP